MVILIFPYTIDFITKCETIYDNAADDAGQHPQKLNSLLFAVNPTMLSSP